MKFKLLREVRVYGFKENDHKFQKKRLVALFLLCMKVKKRYISICNTNSTTVYMGRITNQTKVPKWLSFKKLQVKITKYLMCIYEGHRCTCMPNMKILCLVLLLGKVCTDDANANDDAQNMIV